MASKNFSNFTAQASPNLTDFVVGYETAVSGGERRTALTDILNLFKQNTTTGGFVLSGNGSGGFANTDLTYSTPTLSVPDAFNISGAGSISLTAGGSNKGIGLFPQGTGGVGIGILGNTETKLQILSTAASTPVVAWNAKLGNPLLSALGESVNPFILIGGASATSTQGPALFTMRSRGTLAVPTAVAANDRGLYITASAYDGTNFINSASLGFDIISSGTDAVPQSLSYASSTTGNGTRNNRVTLDYRGFLVLGVSSATIPAWSTSGAFLRTTGSTITDSSSTTGTVASAVFNSFAIPTINASSASVVYTNLANLYIAGDVATTGNASATNSYGLWNVGKTRLGGAVVGDVQALSGAGAVNVTQPNTDYTSTGAAQALTLANGTIGQEKTISHVVDGGSGVLTPTTKIGFTTITFTNVGDSVTLRYTASGWAIVGIFGAVAA